MPVSLQLVVCQCKKKKNPNHEIKDKQKLTMLEQAEMEPPPGIFLVIHQEGASNKQLYKSQGTKWWNKEAAFQPKSSSASDFYPETLPGTGFPKRKDFEL